MAQNITLEESAKRVGVSTATIRNWVKTKYLVQAGKGLISLESLENFVREHSGKEKLTQRANKSLKDSHDHDSVIAKFLEKIELSERLTDEIGGEYESNLSDSYRNKEGIYYTPPQVVNDLFEIPKEGITFCDPCCGSGNFIVRALEIGFKPENIYGYDIDPVAVDLTKKRIFERTGYKSKNIRVGDFLTIASLKDTQKFDSIFTNPPWGKKLPKEDRDSFGTRFGTGSSLDTCSLFFFACLESLSPNGRLGMLLPESFFNISTFESARRRALQLSIERLVDYGKAFIGLVTKAQAIVLTKKPADENHKVKCQNRGEYFEREIHSFSTNPKAILNLYCKGEGAAILKHLRSIPHKTLHKQGSWGLGIVTGNNKKYLKNKPEAGHIAVFKGSDISQNGLKEATSFIPADLTLYQQVAPIGLFKAKEKLIYRFISSRLCFFYDTKQRFLLNSANLLIPNEDFPIKTRVLGELLSSDFMNWVFSNLFNTHKILRGDLESLPIHTQFLVDAVCFDEEKYLHQLQIEATGHGTYRIKN